MYPDVPHFQPFGFVLILLSWQDRERLLRNIYISSLLPLHEDQRVIMWNAGKEMRFLHQNE